MIHITEKAIRNIIKLSKWNEAIIDGLPKEDGRLIFECINVVEDFL